VGAYERLLYGVWSRVLCEETLLKSVSSVLPVFLFFPVGRIEHDAGFKLVSSMKNDTLSKAKSDFSSFFCLPLLVATPQRG
jgi:hypothetical protein